LSGAQRITPSTSVSVTSMCTQPNPVHDEKMMLDVLVKPCQTPPSAHHAGSEPPGRPQIKHERSHFVDHPPSLQRNRCGSSRGQAVFRRNLDGTFPVCPPAVFTGTRASNGECPCHSLVVGHSARSRRSSARQFRPARDSQRANRENRATHGPQDQADRGHQRLAEAANILAGHGNTGG